VPAHPAIQPVSCDPEEHRAPGSCYSTAKFRARSNLCADIAATNTRSIADESDGMSEGPFARLRRRNLFMGSRFGRSDSTEATRDRSATIILRFPKGYRLSRISICRPLNRGWMLLVCGGSRDRGAALLVPAALHPRLSQHHFESWWAFE
jgi:hypothetical protein